MSWARASCPGPGRPPVVAITFRQSYSLNGKGQTLRWNALDGEKLAGETMDEDETDSKAAKKFEPLVFDTLSIEELTAYIAELKEEIARAEAAIDAKRGFRESAQDVFRG